MKWKTEHKRIISFKLHNVTSFFKNNEKEEPIMKQFIDCIGAIVFKCKQTVA